MATLYGVLLAMLLATAHAQSDFCENRPPCHAGDDATFTHEIETKYFDVGEEGVPLATNNNHDLVEGNCTDLKDMYLIILDVVCEEPDPEGVVSHYNSWGFGSHQVVTCIKCLDRHEDGRGGYPQIMSGGVGTGWLVLTYNSQRYQGLRFYTEVYVRRPTK